MQYLYEHPEAISHRSVTACVEALTKIALRHPQPDRLRLVVGAHLRKAEFMRLVSEQVEHEMAELQPLTS